MIAGAVPLLLCAAGVLAIGDEFGSAITYHTQRALQVESLAASPFEVAHVLGTSGISSGVGHGGFEIHASDATAARWVSVALGALVYLWLAIAGWRSRVTNLQLVTALLTVMVVFAPVLSPQFLLWILPVSACAYGLGKENAVLLATSSSRRSCCSTTTAWIPSTARSSGRSRLGTWPCWSTCGWF